MRSDFSSNTIPQPDNPTTPQPDTNGAQPQRGKTSSDEAFTEELYGADFLPLKPYDVITMVVNTLEGIVSYLVNGINAGIAFGPQGSGAVCELPICETPFAWGEGQGAALFPACSLTNDKQVRVRAAARQQRPGISTSLKLPGRPAEPCTRTPEMLRGREQRRRCFSHQGLRHLRTTLLNVSILLFAPRLVHLVQLGWQEEWEDKEWYSTFLLVLYTAYGRTKILLFIRVIRVVYIRISRCVRERARFHD